METKQALPKRYLIFNFLAIGLMIFVVTLIILNITPSSWQLWIEKKLGFLLNLDEAIIYFIIFILTLPLDYLIAKLMQKLSGYDKLKPFLITSLLAAAIFSTIVSFLILYLFIIIFYCGLDKFFRSCAID